MNKEELYNKYKYLIYKVIKDLNCRYRTEEEWQEYYDFGEMGLLKAINTYDFRNEKSTYFYKCIRREILWLFRYKGMNKRKINYLLLESLNDKLQDDAELYEIIEDQNVDIEKQILKNEKYEILYKAIDSLKPSYKDIICKYYGIKCKKYTLEEIALIYNTSRQALHFKKDNALKTLKKTLLENGVDNNEL